MSSNVLATKDVNTSMMATQERDSAAILKPDVKSMEYHRQVFQSKRDQEEYVLPSQPTNPLQY